jgi:hypothetical protein
MNKEKLNLKLNIPFDEALERFASVKKKELDKYKEEKSNKKKLDKVLETLLKTPPEKVKYKTK